MLEQQPSAEKNYICAKITTAPEKSKPNLRLRLPLAAPSHPTAPEETPTLGIQKIC